MWNARQNLIDWGAGLVLARSPRWPVALLPTAAALAGLAAAAAYWPPLRAFFGLQFWPVVGLELLAFAFAGVLAEIDRRIGLTPLMWGLGLLGVAFLFQLFTSSVVVFSNPPGSFALASFPLVALWVQGLLLQATPRAPLVVVAHAAGMLCAFALRPELAQGLVLLLAFPLGAAGALVLGSLAEADARRQRDLGDHRATIEAQVLEAQAIERDRIAATLALLGERRGDARRLLAAALAQIDQVDARVGALPVGAERSEAAALAGGLRVGLDRLERAVADSGPPGGDRGAAVPLVAVDAARVAGKVAAEAARRFLGVAIAGPTPNAASGPQALVRGGAESLQLILEHLVQNACQGDGASGARAVAIAVSTGTAFVDVVVRDDGPGLRAELLAAPVRPFVTTKHEGTGLGLYTASRLAAASGGELLRENPAGGGARLTLRLPAAPDSP